MAIRRFARIVSAGCRKIKNKMGMGSHQSADMKSDTWLTPPELLRALGKFDLDPCCPIVRPWDTAEKHYDINDNGLQQPWHGRVWCNPPYGLEAVKWLRKMVDHGNGTALIFARTETAMFFETVWRKATGVLFLEGRLYFHRADGSRAAANAGAPSCLVAYSDSDAAILKSCGISGHYVQIK